MPEQSFFFSTITLIYKSNLKKKKKSTSLTLILTRDRQETRDGY